MCGSPTGFPYTVFLTSGPGRGRAPARKKTRPVRFDLGFSFLDFAVWVFVYTLVRPAGSTSRELAGPHQAREPAIGHVIVD